MASLRQLVIAPVTVAMLIVFVVFFVLLVMAVPTMFLYVNGPDRLVVTRPCVTNAVGFVVGVRGMSAVIGKADGASAMQIVSVVSGGKRP